MAAAVNHQGDDKNGVSAADLKNAMSVPWLAQAISHLVVRYDNEGGGNMGVGEKFSSLIGDQERFWQVELERIEKLKWWDQVQAIKDFPQEHTVWHFHPVGIVGNFGVTRKRRDYALGKLSSQYETGGRGASTISGGQGDPGGVSYGSYQMTSKTRQRDGSFIIGCMVKKFVNSPGFSWSSEFF